MSKAQEYTEALTIAGHDSDGSAGMSADLHTFYACGVYGMGILTAAVAGNSQGIYAQQLMPIDFIEKQFAVLNDDFKIKAVKTGMLANKEIIHVVSQNIEKYKLPNVVLDPVIITKHGASLLDNDAYQALIDELLPLADIVTPNFYEAQKLTDLELKDDTEIQRGAQRLQNMGAKNVLIKGKPDLNNEVRDYLLLADSSELWLSKPYFKTNRVNGTGDTLSAVITAELAKNTPIKDAVILAKNFTYEALSHPINVGSKYGPINHLAAQSKLTNLQSNK